MLNELGVGSGCTKQLTMNPLLNHATILDYQDLVGAADGRLFVLDSGNSRVQIGEWVPGPVLSETALSPLID